eukprot:582904-Pyramimonas_sp.AAC.1
MPYYPSASSPSRSGVPLGGVAGVSNGSNTEGCWCSNCRNIFYDREDPDSTWTSDDDGNDLAESTFHISAQMSDSD